MQKRQLRLFGRVRLRPSVVASFCVAISVVAIGACTTDYQQGKGDPNYGGPNALANQVPPGSTSDNTADGGMTTSTVVGATPACVTAGGKEVDGGPCTISFAKDILSAFGTAGCNAPSCHGGTSPQNLPRVEPSDGPGTWQGFQGFTLSSGKPYIDPCSADDTQSQMACNFIATGGAGACGIHMPSGSQLPDTAIANVKTWLKCGSPNN